MRVGLGIDCATACGLSLVGLEAGKERMLDHWTVDLADLRMSVGDVVQGVFDRAARHCLLGELVVAIELPYLGKNPHVLQVLARFCGRFEQEADERSCRQVHVVGANTWQTSVLGRFGGRKREDRKKAAQLWRGPCSTRV